MNIKKEDTPERINRRKYEQTHKDKRRETYANFQTMIPKELFVEIDKYLKENNITKVQFIKEAFDNLKK